MDLKRGKAAAGGPADKGKVAAAAAVLDLIEPGMKVGLGTGSTAERFVEALGARVREGLAIVGVPTSLRTGRLAEKSRIPMTTLDEAGWLDVTVDGADEVDPALNLIKGGGGALLTEKIVACASDRMIVIADDRKDVAVLGAFPLPIEITPFAWETTRAIVEQTVKLFDVDGAESALRLAKDSPFLTDEGNFIIDLKLRRIGKPAELAAALNAIPGVVDNGLFIQIAERAVFGRPDGTVYSRTRP